jgi:hypothetical protein
VRFSCLTLNPKANNWRNIPITLKFPHAGEG